jgi:hypothetical protein
MFKLAVRIDYRIKGRCPWHPAYNPMKDEQAGIRGGCAACHELLDAYRAYLALREAIERFETAARPFIAARKARGRSVQGSCPSTPEPPSCVGREFLNGNLVSSGVLSK